MSRIIIAMALLATTSSAFAQSVPPVPAPPPGQERAAPDSMNPAVHFLMRSDKISRQEAEERIDLQRDIAALLQSSGLMSDPSFVDLVVRHTPSYQVILSFSREGDRSGLVNSVPPKLRRYVKIRVAKDQPEKRKSGVESLQQTIARTGISAIPDYDSLNERFVVDVASASDAATLRSAFPSELAANVEVRIKPLPVAQAAPTGVRAGDWAEAGYDIWTTGTNQPCTLAFPITFNGGKKGILTAAHCTEPKYINYADHKVTFQSAFAENNSGAYDVAIYETTGLTSDYQIFYRDKNQIPEFSDTGWLNTKNFIRRANSWVGMSVCKSGNVTGITCGKIQSITYPWSRPGTYWVLVSDTLQSEISDPGDSGGPWFSYVDARTTKDVSALGIHVAGAGAGYGSEGVYMPIDRIFESFSSSVSGVTLVTTPW